MLFNSYIFILLFLPLVLISFYTLKGRSRRACKVVLVLMSLWFYGYFNLSYLWIMLFSIVVNYAFYLWICRSSYRRRVLSLGIAMNLGLLFYYKYFDFFIDNCNALFNLNMPLKHIVLPLGISFFTFQQIGFLTDTYRGQTARTDFIDYALFVSFFPQLVAGPIVEYEEMMPQFRQIGRKITEQEFASSLFMFIIGLAKKVLIADTFGIAVDWAFDAVNYGINSTEALLAILFYTLQLYFDFSGYCDMAIGLAGMLGIRLPVNFDSPYKAVHIIDFWKRWHITLNRFFMKNIYIPLGGNRKGKVRMYVNLAVVFLLSGIWHGAGWNYILWGVMHGALYIVTRFVLEHTGEWHKISKAVSRIFTFVFVAIAWTYFRAPDIATGTEMLRTVLKHDFHLVASPMYEAFNLGELWYVLKLTHLASTSFGPYICMLGFIIASLLTVNLAPNSKALSVKCRYGIPSAAVLACLLVWCVVSLSGVSTFLYFNF